MRSGWLLVVAAWMACSSAGPSAFQASSSLPQSLAAPSPTDRTLIDQYCVSCHNDRLRTGGLTLATLDPTNAAANAEIFEKVVRKLRAGVMPPAGLPRPDKEKLDAFVTAVETSLDRAAAASPEPGRTAAFHRLNRAEYHNAIRDLLALDIDLASLLPPDTASYGFDNIGDVLGLSPTLLERYMSAARKISRVAVGDPRIAPATETFRVPSDLTQDDRFEDQPFGTRGGIVIRYSFPVDGEYAIRVRLARESVTDAISGLKGTHQIEVTLDGERLQLFTLSSDGPAPTMTNGEGGKGKNEPQKRSRRDAGFYGDDFARVADAGLQLRTTVKAGPRVVRVAFLKHPSAEVESIRQPFLRGAPENGDSHGHPYLNTVAISGPYNVSGAGDTPSRRRIFLCRPATKSAELPCARRILTVLARRAYRRPPTDTDVEDLLQFYVEGRGHGTFESAVELALVRLLVGPSFLFRVEQDPDRALPGSVYRVSDLELASRLSFFLWSSLPDDQLLDLAARGTLKDPAIVEQQVRRMLADRRADALVANFAGQWLYLRNVPSVLPDRRLFPDFDENLRRAFRRETELFFGSIAREDRSLLELLTADYTFVNERLARHYGIPNVYGDRFRRVTLADGVRGGLLGQGSILTVRSYANRTSPVLRGVWILDNILGTPPPPPPANVPPLKDTNAAGAVLSMREQMAQHRESPICASCHSRMDLLGLPMENFDAIGRWRDHSESNRAIDVSGALPDGTKFDGVAGLRQALLSHAGEFVTTATEKLLTYALGRGVEYYDAPAIRRIARDARQNNYRFSSIIVGIVQSAPFQLRRAAESVSAGVPVSSAR